MRFADRDRYIATAMNALTTVRFYRGQDGLFIALSPDEDVDALVETIEGAISEP